MARLRSSFSAYSRLGMGMKARFTSRGMARLTTTVVQVWRNTALTSIKR